MTMLFGKKPAAPKEAEYKVNQGTAVGLNTLQAEKSLSSCDVIAPFFGTSFYRTKVATCLRD